MFFNFLHVILDVGFIFWIVKLMEKYTELGLNIFTKLSQKRFNRMVMLVLFFQVCVGLIWLFLGYFWSLVNGGNFGIVATLNSLAQIYGKIFFGTPLFNALSEIGSIIIVGLLLYCLLFYVKKKKIAILPVEVVKDEMVYSLNDKFAVRIPLSIVSDVLIFGLLLQIDIRFLFFYFGVYPKVLPPWFFVLMILFILLTTFYFLIFNHALKEFLKFFAIQLLFLDLTEYKELRHLIDRIIEKDSIVVLGKEIFSGVELYIDLDLILMRPKSNVEQLMPEEQYRMEVPSDVVTLYLLEKEKCNKKHSNADV